MIEIFLKYFETGLFRTKSELIYEGHVPSVGYLIETGEVHIYQNDTLHKVLKSGSFIGIKEVLSRVPCNFMAQVAPGTSLFFLDVGGLRRHLSDDFSEIKKYIENIAPQQTT